MFYVQRLRILYEGKSMVVCTTMALRNRNIFRYVKIGWQTVVVHSSKKLKN